MNLPGIGGVEQVHDRLLEYPILRRGPRGKVLSDSRIAHLSRGKSLQQRPKIEVRAAGNHDGAAAPDDIIHGPPSELGPPACGEPLPRIGDVEEMVNDRAALLLPRLGGPDVEAAIDGEGIPGHDLRPRPERDLNRRGALAGSGHAEDDRHPSLDVHRSPRANTKRCPGAKRIPTSEYRSVRKTGTPARSRRAIVSGAGCPKRLWRPHESSAARGLAAASSSSVV